MNNTCINHLHRTRRPEPLPKHSPLADPTAGPPESAITNAQFIAVRTAIASLPQRAPLFLSEYEGLSYPDIAEITKASVPAVRSQLFRARRALTRILAK